MTLFKSPYPDNAFFLRQERKYRFRGLNGQIDMLALGYAEKLLPTAPELTSDQRARLLRIADRIQKGAVAFGDLAEVNMLDERFGVPIVIEVPDGGERTGIGADGTPWSKRLVGCAYGFLIDTVARDAEEIDVILGPNAEAADVFIICQMAPPLADGQGGQLDEYKLAIGFDYEGAESCYAEHWGRERLGQIMTMPMEILRGLLGFEAVEGAITKAVDFLRRDDSLVVSGPHGMLMAHVRKVAKGVTGVSTFAPGGALLPTQQTCTDKASRCAKALDGAIAYQGATRLISSLPELAEHPALTLPLSWTYEDPAKVGGWLGGIEPADESWICFVDVAGHALLWVERADDGGVQGIPIALARLDIATSKAVPDRYGDIDFSPPDGVREAARRGLALHEEGKTGDGIEPATIAWARRIADGESISPEKARQGNAWFGRNERFKDEPKDSPAWAAWMLWFGEEGRAWFGKLVEQMDARDNADASKSITKVKLCTVAKGLDQQTPIDRRIVYGIVLEPEPFGGRGDAHDETYSRDVIRRAAYQWLANYGCLNDSHGRFLSKQEIVPVESFIAPCDFTIGGTQIREGTWIVAAKVLSDPLWVRIVNGKLNAWSIEGHAERECGRCSTLLVARRRNNETTWLCPQCDRVALLST